MSHTQRIALTLALSPLLALITYAITYRTTVLDLQITNPAPFITHNLTQSQIQSLATYYKNNH